MTIKTQNFERAVVSLQSLVESVTIGHRMRIVADYDSGKRHILTNYLELKDTTKFENIPDDMQFFPTKINCGVDWKYGTVKKSGRHNRKFSEENLQSTFALLGLSGMCGTNGKVRVIVDYDPDKEEISIKRITLAE